jgi:C4-dicarboxylate transporter DctM subunit
MSPISIGLIGFGILFAFIVLGLPIGIAMAVVGYGGLWILISQGAAFAKMGLIPFEVVSSWDLATLPMFLLMAHVVFASGLSKDLYNIASKLIGHHRGGIAMATVGATGVFAAMSASSVATGVTMGLVAIPEMKKYNYNPGLATGCIAAGGTMGQMIPPSAGLITFGIIAQVSIGRLFIGGVIPGIIEALFYIIVIAIICRIKPDYGPPGPRFSFKERILSFKSSGEIIALVLLVLGGLVAGWFTPTEAGAVGAFGAIFFSLIRRRLIWSGFKRALAETMKTTGMLYGILIGAYLFKYFMAVTTIPVVLAEVVGGLPLPPLAIMALILVVYFFLGCVMDALAMILLTIPIFFPLAMQLGFDPVWFGVVLIAMTEVGMITPPIGMNVYAIAGIAPEVPITTIFRGILPFLAADIIRITLYLLIPGIVLFLPNLMMGG